MLQRTLEGKHTYFWASTISDMPKLGGAKQPREFVSQQMWSSATMFTGPELSPLRSLRFWSMAQILFRGHLVPPNEAFTICFLACTSRAIVCLNGGQGFTENRMIPQTSPNSRLPNPIWARATVNPPKSLLAIAFALLGTKEKYRGFLLALRSSNLENCACGPIRGASVSEIGPKECKFLASRTGDRRNGKKSKSESAWRAERGRAGIPPAGSPGRHPSTMPPKKPRSDVGCR